MAKDRSAKAGKIPDGWAGQGLQLPEKMRNEFRVLSGEFGHGGVKVLGTAGVSILLALTPEQREVICQYVFQKTHRNPASLEKKRVLELLKHLLEDDDGTPPVEPAWIVDKIVDPELSQPPGRKKSDRADRERKKSG